MLSAGYVNDALQIEKSLNFSLPAWATPDVLKQTDECHKIASSLLGATRRSQKLRAGVFLYDLKKKIEKAILNPTDRGLKKLNVYSTVSFSLKISHPENFSI